MTMTIPYIIIQSLKHLIPATICLILSVINLSVWARDIEFTVHSGPGGPSDRTTRLIAQHLDNDRYVVVNRPGASGRIAMRHVMAKPAMTLATMTQIFATNELIFSDLEYRPFGDLEILAVIGIMPNVLTCNSKLGLRDWAALKNHKGSLNFGVGGLGSNEHLATVNLLSQWPNQHQIINYPQGGQTHLTDLLAGNIDCIFANLPLVREWIKDPNRLVAVMSSHKLDLAIPAWEQIFGQSYTLSGYLAIVVGRNQPDTVRKEMRQDVIQALGAAGLRDRIRDLGLIPVLSWDAATVSVALEQQRSIQDFITRRQIKLQDR